MASPPTDYCHNNWRNFYGFVNTFKYDNEVYATKSIKEIINRLFKKFIKG